MKRLILVGAGGFGREVLGWAKAHPDCGRRWKIGGFLDDDPQALEGYDYPFSVIGSIADYQPSVDDLFVCAIGTPAIKEKVCQSLLAREANFLTLVHPSVIIGDNVRLGSGVVLCPGVVLTCDIDVGSFVMINCLSSVGHDAKIGAWATLSAHCEATGHVQIGPKAFLGSGARVLPHKEVGAGALVGAGSVVIRHVKAGTRVFGTPARVF